MQRILLVAVPLATSLALSDTSTPRAHSTSRGPELIGTRVFSEVTTPLRLRRGPSGEFYVLSSADHSIVVHDSTLQPKGRLGRIGKGPGELYHPSDFAVASDGTVWVADMGNDRVQTFDAAGSWRTAFCVSRPISIECTPDGHVVVVSATDRDLFRVYSSSGVLSSVVPGRPVAPTTQSERLNSYLQRGTVRAGPDADAVFYVFKGLPEGNVTLYNWRNGSARREWIVTGEAMPSLSEAAKARIAENVRDGSTGMRHVLNAVALDPNRRLVWVAPAAPWFYVYSLDGEKVGEFQVRTEYGLAGAQDLLWAPDRDELLLVAGRFCFRTSPWR